MKPLIIYHANCTDGFGAAFSAWQAWGDDADYVPAHYGDCVISAGSMDIGDKNYPLTDRTVIILDYSIPVSEMCELMETANYVIWLDHHKTAFDAWCGPDYLKPDRQSFRQNSYTRNSGETIPCTFYLDNQKSGAQIAWEEFVGIDVPMLIHHIADRDLWKFKISGTKAVIEGLRMEEESFRQWNSLLTIEGYERVSRNGEVLLRATQSRVSKATRGELHPVTLRDIKGLALNATTDISEIGHAICEKSGTFSLTFFIKDGEAIISLRSQGVVDVSAIAKYYGGGGHRNAAGFRMPIQQFFSEIWK